MARFVTPVPTVTFCGTKSRTKQFYFSVSDEPSGRPHYSPYHRQLQNGSTGDSLQTNDHLHQPRNKRMSPTHRDQCWKGVRLCVRHGCCRLQRIMPRTLIIARYRDAHSVALDWVLGKIECGSIRSNPRRSGIRCTMQRM